MSEIVSKEDIPEGWQFQASLSDHPVIEDDHGILRYRKNGLIDWLWQHDHLPLNEMRIAYTATGAWSLEEYMQFYRDMGYSLSGFSEVFADELEELEGKEEHMQNNMAGSIFFKSAGHKTRFFEVMAQMDKVYDGNLDPEYGAALYILTSNLSIWAKASYCVFNDRIKITTMLEEVHLSSGYNVLVRLAGNLFNNEQHVDPLEFLSLDEDNFTIALDAIKLRREGMHVAE